MVTRTIADVQPGPTVRQSERVGTGPSPIGNLPFNEDWWKDVGGIKKKPGRETGPMPSSGREFDYTTLVVPGMATL